MSGNTENPMPQQEPPPETPRRRNIVTVASVGAGVQFGWALQFSLLTPYVQLLGIPHKWVSYIWLCGPISGIVVQPLVGYYSDRCTSSFGRRRPFIAAAAALISMAAILIGFAADIGRLSGDPLGPRVTKPRAIAIFVLGFWILDVANNVLMAPCRALLADLSGDNQRWTRNANVLYAFFSAVGSIMGYAAGSFYHLHNIFPFTSTRACDTYCANLKSCFLISISQLLTLTTLALSTAREHPICGKAGNLRQTKEEQRLSFVREFSSALKEFPRSMWILFFAVFLHSTAFFTFLVYDTDWMGKEVYGGRVGEKLYDKGVRAGSLGLVLNAAVSGATAVAVMLMDRGGGGGNRLWGWANVFLGVCLGSTVWITYLAKSTRENGAVAAGPPSGVKAAALALFAALGIPQAVCYSIPFALAAAYSNKAGRKQGLYMGVLNLAIATPLLVVSLTSGPWDELFGGSNLPSFVVGAILAVAGGVVVLTWLPNKI